MSLSKPRSWYRDNFLISTDTSLLQPSAIQAAFATTDLYWARPMPDDLMRLMLQKSLCFGVYALPKSSADIAGRSSPAMIGLARLITDYVTFASMTDVYILDEYRGHGLGKWLIDCVNETTDSWPELRRVLLIADESKAKNFYETQMNMKAFNSKASGLVVMSKHGKGSVLEH